MSSLSLGCNWRLGTEEDADLRPTKIGMLAAHDAKDHKQIRKIQRRINKLVNRVL